MRNITQKYSEASTNKVGVSVETRKLLDTLNGETGIPRTRLVKDAIERHARRLRKRRTVAA